MYKLTFISILLITTQAELSGKNEPDGAGEANLTVWTELADLICGTSAMYDRSCYLWDTKTNDWLKTDDSGLEIFRRVDWTPGWLDEDPDTIQGYSISILPVFQVWGKDSVTGEEHVYMYAEYHHSYDRLNQWYNCLTGSDGVLYWDAVSHADVPDWVLEEGIKTDPNSDKGILLPDDDWIGDQQIGGWWSDEEIGTIDVIVDRCMPHQDGCVETEFKYHYRGGEWYKNNDIKKEGEWFRTVLQPRDAGSVPQFARDVVNGDFIPRHVLQGE